MAFNSLKFIAIVAMLATCSVAETIQLQPTQGILIPAPLAENIRVSRSAYGSAAPSYSAHAAAPAYAAPAAPAYAAPAPAAPAYSAPAPSAPAYSAPASIPAPPCPKNYLFSCQPSLQPVPCSAAAPSYGSSGAYSHYMPQYAVPLVRELL